MKFHQIMNKLVNIKLDGKNIQTEEGKNIVDVAKENEVYIPTLCYFREINPIRISHFFLNS